MSDFTEDDGLIGSLFITWGAESNTKKNSALAGLKQSQATVAKADADRIDALTDRDKAANRRTSVDDDFQQGRAVTLLKGDHELRGLIREEEKRDGRHLVEMTGLFAELIGARTKLTEEQTKLLGSQLSLEALKQYGPGFYGLKAMMKAFEIAGITLPGDDMRALVEHHMGALPKPPKQEALPPPKDDNLEEQLLAMQQQMAANGGIVTPIKRKV